MEIVDSESLYPAASSYSSGGGLTDGVNGNIVGVEISTVLDTTLQNNGGTIDIGAIEFTGLE